MEDFEISGNNSDLSESEQIRLEEYYDGSVYTCSCGRKHKSPFYGICPCEYE